MVRVGQGSGSDCSHGIRDLSILCHERGCCFAFLDEYMCVLDSLEILAVLERVGQGTHLREGKEQRTQAG